MSERIEIVAAFFADAANQGEDARFSVIGGGLHSVESDRFPLPLDVEAIVVGLRVTAIDQAAAVLEMRLVGPEAVELARVAGDLEVRQPVAVIDSPGDPSPISERILWVVLPLPDILLAHPGVYRCHFELNGRPDPYTLPLVVSPIADAAPESRPN